MWVATPLVLSCSQEGTTLSDARIMQASVSLKMASRVIFALLGSLVAGAVSCSPRPTSNSAAPSIEAKGCGMPAEIRKKFWPRRLSPTTQADPAPPPVGTTTIAVLPDTQYYVSCRDEHFRKQSEWIAAERGKRNIVATITLGDITEHNTREEWEFVSSALSPLRNEMPLLLAPGNHDYGNGGKADERRTFFDDYLTDSGLPTQGALAAQFPPKSLQNAYYRLAVGQNTLGVLVLEWSPRKVAVDWARDMLKSYPGDRLIFVTHAYLYHDDSRYDFKKHGASQEWSPKTYGTAAGGDAYDGQMLWDGLLNDQPGLFLTLSGHVLADGSGLLSSRAKAGNLVHQVLVNYQMLDEGGLAYLRLVELLPNKKELRMKTYSPSLSRFATGKDQSFTLKIDPPLQ